MSALRLIAAPLRAAFVFLRAVSLINTQGEARLSMDVYVNEKAVRLYESATAGAAREKFKPDADIIIVNGFPVAADHALAEADRVTLIRRGEVPTPEELEALLVARHTPGVHARVRSAVVGIAGAGGLGSFVALALARTGVGRLVIADHDIVEPSNLNRQQYFIDQIGEPKVHALAHTIARVNPNVKVVPHHTRVTAENLASLFGDVEVMVEAFDDAREKAMLAEAFRLTRPGVPLVASSGLAGSGESNDVRTHLAGRDLFIIGDGTSAAEPGQGLMAPRVGVAAHHQANAVLRLLLGESPA